MNKPLSIFNWSLKRALEDVPDNFLKARIRIIYTILLFSVLKIAIVIGIATANEQWLQVIRGIIAAVFYVSLIKLVLYRPHRLNLLAHTMLILGIFVVWSTIFVFAHKINMPSLQFVFMIILSSFYTLGGGFGIFYSALGIIPILVYLFSGGDINIYVTNTAQELASPGFEIIIILNFLSIVVSHYLFYQAFTFNIKEKEKLNKELQLSIAEANQLATSKSNFLSTMSHELRTPLNSVIGITELLLADRPEERQKENLKLLHFSTLDLLSLINNVLDFNKIDSDKLTLEKVQFSLAELMKNICSVLKVKAQDKHLNFILDIDPQLEKTEVISDPTRLSQLMYNLVGNAIKFTEQGSITVKLECTQRSNNDIEVLFSVKDTGIGIHPERQESIFELFTQAESHITRKYGGTGLGLAIVKQILTLFHSSIQLESSPGNGAHFFFTIPFNIASETTITEAADAPAYIDLSQLRILVAEDNELNRVIIGKQFAKLDLKPQIVENGQLAYEAVVNNNFDVIFMDLHMPVLDGYEATRQIRALPNPEKAGIFIIAFTASVTEQQQIQETGFDDYLYKPVNMNDLSSKLEKIASSRIIKTV